MKIKEFLAEWKTFTEDDSVRALGFEHQVALFDKWCAMRGYFAKADYISKVINATLIEAVQATIKEIEKSVVSQAVPGLDKTLKDVQEKLEEAMRKHREQHGTDGEA